MGAHAESAQCCRLFTRYGRICRRGARRRGGLVLNLGQFTNPVRSAGESLKPISWKAATARSDSQHWNSRGACCTWEKPRPELLVCWKGITAVTRITHPPPVVLDYHAVDTSTANNCIPIAATTFRYCHCVPVGLGRCSVAPRSANQSRGPREGPRATGNGAV